MTSFILVHLTKIPTFFQGSNLCHGNLGKIPEITEQFSTRHATSYNHCIYDTVTNYINWKSTYVWELQKDEKMSSLNVLRTVAAIISFFERKKYKH